MNDKVYAEEGKGTQVLESLEGAEGYHKWLAAKIKPYLGNNNLEVGAGRGAVSEMIIDDAKVLLSDLAKYNIQFLKKKFKNNTNLLGVTGDIFKLKKNNYSCIYSSNVLEHIEDDLSFIGSCLPLLKKSGNFVAVVPAMQFLFSEFDQSIGHYRRYESRDKDRIEQYLKSNKIKAKLIEYRYFNQIGSFGWFVKMKLLKKKSFGKYDIPLFHFLLPFNKLLDKLNLPFGQSVLLVIKKG